MFELAGRLRINPYPFSLRELVLMHEAHSKELWSHTSSILALIANANRDPSKGKPFSPDDFNPHVERKPTGIPLTKKTLHLLKGML